MHELVTCCHFCVLLHKSPYSRTLSVRYYTMSSGPSRPGSPPIPDLDEWSGSESGGLASKPVETTRGVDPHDRDSTSTEREVLADTAHEHHPVNGKARHTMSSGPSRPGSPPIPDLDEWSGSESGGLASKPVHSSLNPVRGLYAY